MNAATAIWRYSSRDQVLLQMQGAPLRNQGSDGAAVMVAARCQDGLNSLSSIHVILHSIPLHSIPFHSIPFHFTLLRFIPLHSVPFHSTLFHSIPCGSPLAASRHDKERRVTDWTRRRAPRRRDDSRRFAVPLAAATRRRLRRCFQTLSLWRLPRVLVLSLKVSRDNSVSHKDLVS